MTAIRLYGHQLGHASFAQVTRGFRWALEDAGLFAGFVPIDFLEDEGEYGGATAPIGINTGSPSAVVHAKAMGQHEERWLMLAPNSDRVPSEMLEWLPKIATGLLSPSEWGSSVLRSLFGAEMPVVTCPHGIQRGLDVVHSMRAERLKGYRQGGFNVLHLTSTNSERKGTRQLLKAWKDVAGAAPSENVALIIVARPEGVLEIRQWAREWSVPGVYALESEGYDTMALKALFGIAHVVCQPSRAEGFGLVPLEARACGVPVVMTLCTGHSEHATWETPGVVGVKSGALEPIDDMAGASAPSVSVAAVSDALVEARERYETLHEAALAHAAEVREAWSWPSKTGPVLQTLARRER